ncbi:hypothetical protein DC498_08185 [Terrimonas sp.]|uniref:DUF5018-related domain-containing protein n=1 Tax=Terrimonas sp. TaxID=1914338 RepID=UPI000D523ED7|nr:hypothetical protein [Terrimonas sp.]PVD52890.1 hypothetical protein DC498_08185 [Terrimonas sp.]
MKKYLKVNILVLPTVVFILSSCLKSGLNKDLPAFADAKITDIFFEYRYLDSDSHSSDGSNLVRVVQLPVSNKEFKLKESTPGAPTDSIIATVTVPSSDKFTPQTERDKVTASYLVCKTNISTAARIEPVATAPKMGTPGDFSLPRQYKVIAADGQVERIWTLKIILAK